MLLFQISNFLISAPIAVNQSPNSVVPACGFTDDGSDISDSNDPDTGAPVLPVLRFAHVKEGFNDLFITFPLDSQTAL